MGDTERKYVPEFYPNNSKSIADQHRDEFQRLRGMLMKALMPLLTPQERRGMLPMPPANPLQQYIDGSLPPKRDSTREPLPTMIGVRG